MRRSQRLRSLQLAVAIGFGISGAAIAQLPVRYGTAGPAILPVAPAAGLPSNSVDCVYNMMPTEDREMALLLLEREAASDVKSHSGSRNLRVMTRLIEEARARCSPPYIWSSVNSDAATEYAMNELVSSGISQALAAKGETTESIDVYYASHHTGLVGVSSIEAARADEFRDYLIQQGWVRSDSSAFRMAKGYLEALRARERQTQTFAAASRGRPHHRN